MKVKKPLLIVLCCLLAVVLIGLFLFSQLRVVCQADGVELWRNPPEIAVGNILLGYAEAGEMLHFRGIHKVAGFEYYHVSWDERQHPAFVSNSGYIDKSQCHLVFGAP